MVVVAGRKWINDADRSDEVDPLQVVVVVVVVVLLLLLLLVLEGVRGCKVCLPGKREVSPPTHPARRQGRRILEPFSSNMTKKDKKPP